MQLSFLASTAQDDMLYVGHYWTPDEANLKMKEFASTWNDLDAWEKRAETIRNGIIKGTKLDKMPDIKGNFTGHINHMMYRYRSTIKK